MMHTTDNDTSAAVIIARAQEIYDRKLRSQLEATDRGRVVAIDVDSEQFEVGDQILEVNDRLRARLPDATIGFLRIGEKGVYRIGPRGTTTP